MAGQVSTRVARLPEDGPFLLSVYDANRRSEFAVLSWPEDQLVAFMAMQFEAQSRHYGALFPDADNLVVLVDGEPAGRLLVHRGDAEIRIVDIALLPRHQRAGVGAELVRPLLAEADAAGLPVTCHVAVDNEARGFWAHLGFLGGGLDGAHIALERPSGFPPD
jgi:ribosomal protein S18 acetylase RimI-like enzyme